MKRILIPIFILLLFTSVSCDSFFDINNDPTKPTEATIVDLMPAGQMGVVWSFSNQLNRIAADNVQYFSGRYDSWGYDAEDVSNAWRYDLYAGGLMDLQNIITNATETENYHYAGVAKLCKAYAFSIMVDLWNDVPYSEAFNSEIAAPKFDNAKEIYNNLFALIDEAVADLNKPLPAGAADLASSDIVFQGNVAKWKKMASTLKLKMYNQIRLVEPALAKSKIEELVASGTLITSNSDDFVFHYGSSTTPSNQYPGFQNDYAVKGEAHVNSHFYNAMKNNLDPRLPYYFYLQSKRYDGRFTGDPTPVGNNANSRTVQGIYPCGGKYDDGSAKSVDKDAAPGNGDFRMITNVMRLYIECEAALSLNATVSDTPKNLFKKALEANFSAINALSAPDITTEARDQFINARLTAFDNATTNEAKLQVVMNEKWVAMFGNAIEAYNDYRRTGYPVLPSPIQPSNNVVGNRFPYASDELSSNPNAPEQPLNNVKVFWDK